MFYFFFFQAEDGIRDYKVTGVQTCALPICTGFDCYSKVLSVVPLRSHLADHHRRMPGRERVSLHNHRWAWFAVVPCSRDSHNVAAPHRSSNSATDRKSTRLNSSHLVISYAVFCLKKKKKCISHSVLCSD